MGLTMSIVKIDEKGRTILRRKFLSAAGIKVPCLALATAKGEGIIELRVISDDLSRAEKIAAQKLGNWREEEHKGEELLYGMMIHEAHRHGRIHRSD